MAKKYNFGVVTKAFFVGMRIVIIILNICLISFYSQAQTKRTYNAALADSLESWAKVDQVAAGLPKGKFKDLNDPAWQAFKDSVFNNHRQLLDDIFKKQGYPGYDVVGVKGAHFYWLMVQHCDKHPDFQQKILAAMKPEVDKGNAAGVDYAYLTDRVNLNTGKKQLYGTQVTYHIDICQAYPRPTADSLTLNARRKQVGMEPIEAYLNTMTESHFLMNKAGYEARGITGPRLYTVPK